MHMNWKIAIPLYLATLVLATTASAEVKLPAILSNGMVLQAGMKVPIWGTAAEDEKIVVSFCGQKVEATAKGGKFLVELAALTAGGPWTMTIEGKNKIVLPTVYVGEVWVCSGQSNMDSPVSETPQAAEAAKAGCETLRLSKIGGWAPSSEKSIPNFSAVGFFYGKALSDQLKVPVGIIQRSEGGTPAHLWTPVKTLEMLGIKESWSGKNYALMIQPIQPYAIRGVIWYQAEGNVGKTGQYAKLFPAQIQAWRADWGQGDFPFLFVQMHRRCEPPPPEPVCSPKSGWAMMREVQTQTLSLINTGMAVFYDVTDGVLHPPNKKPAGERLALVARALVYGEKIEYSGPMFKEVIREGNKIVLTFSHADDGLMVKGASGLEASTADVQDLFAAKDDGKPVPVPARVEGKTVVVDLSGNPNCTTLYYAWSDYPLGNLYNKSGLPAVPFRVSLKIEVAIPARGKTPVALKLRNWITTPKAWKAQSAQEWLAIEQTAGHTHTSGQETLNVVLDSTKLKPDETVKGTVNVTDEDSGKVQTIEITAKVGPIFNFAVGEAYEFWSSLGYSKRLEDHAVFNVTVGQQESKEFAFSNNSAEEFSWEAASSVPWLKTEPAAGKLKPGEQIFIKVTAKPTDTESTRHETLLTIKAAGGEATQNAKFIVYVIPAYNPPELPKGEEIKASDLPKTMVSGHRANAEWFGASNPNQSAFGPRFDKNGNLYGGTPLETTYKLEGSGFAAFSAKVSASADPRRPGLGIETRSVNFELQVDGQVRAQSGLMKAGDEPRLLVAEGLQNAKKLRLLVRFATADASNLLGFPNTLWSVPTFYKEAAAPAPAKESAK